MWHSFVRRCDGISLWLVYRHIGLQMIPSETGMVRYAFIWRGGVAAADYMFWPTVKRLWTLRRSG